MKKTTAILMAAFLLVSMTACSTSGTQESDTENSVSVSAESSTVAGSDSADNSEETANGSENDTGKQNKNDRTEDKSSSDSDSSQNSTSNGFKAQDGSSQNSNSNGFTPDGSSDSGRTKRDRMNGQMPGQNGDGTQMPQMPDQNGDSAQMPQMPGQNGGNGQMPGQQNSVVSTADDAGELDTTNLFTERDLTQTADLTGAKTITAADNKTETITTEGVYVIKGSAKNFTVKVEADSSAKVQLVLDGLTVENDSTPVIYVVSADKCFVTTASGSTNSLSVTGSYTSDGDTNTDAVIFSKDDLVLNGTGTLNITSSEGNGISGKDDLKITGGTYVIESAKDSIEANDSIAVYDGTFTIRSSKDGLHSENNDDDTTGYIYIKDGTFNITASGDALQATTLLLIDGGTIDANSSEGLESTYIRISGGTVNINASDDGINASTKSSHYSTPTVEFTGGNVTVTMSGSDVDCIDSNGNIIVSGGTINVNYPQQGPSEPFDCDGTATYTGGTIIINGTQVDSIPQSTMGGGGRGGFGGRGF